jgi:hypothetical protein
MGGVSERLLKCITYTVVSGGHFSGPFCIACNPCTSIGVACLVPTIDHIHLRVWGVSGGTLFSLSNFDAVCLLAWCCRWDVLVCECVERVEMGDRLWEFW